MILDAELYVLILRMSSSASIIATLPLDLSQKIVIEAFAKSSLISCLAAEHKVRRKFICQQGHKERISGSKAVGPTKTEH